MGVAATNYKCVIKDIRFLQLWAKQYQLIQVAKKTLKSSSKLAALTVKRRRCQSLARVVQVNLRSDVVGGAKEL